MIKTSHYLPPHSSINVATESRSGPGAAMRRMFEIPSKTTWITCELE